MFCKHRQFTFKSPFLFSEKLLYLFNYKKLNALFLNIGNFLVKVHFCSLKIFHICSITNGMHYFCLVYEVWWEGWGHQMHCLQCIISVEPHIRIITWPDNRLWSWCSNCTEQKGQSMNNDGILTVGLSRSSQC